MKHLNDFTIKEFNEFNQLVEQNETNSPNVFDILELFGVKDSYKLPVDEFESKWREIQNMTLSTKGVSNVYNINGRRFKANLDVLKLSAGQFIDLQTYMANFKLEECLSVILIPQHRGRFFGWETYDYADGYDPIEVQQFLLNNMKIGQASELSAFFLKTSGELLKTMVAFSTKKLFKMRLKKLKKDQKDQKI